MEKRDLDLVDWRQEAPGKWQGVGNAVGRTERGGCGMRKITLAVLGIAVSLCLAGSAFAAGATKDECVA